MKSGRRLEGVRMSVRETSSSGIRPCDAMSGRNRGEMKLQTWIGTGVGAHGGNECSQTCKLLRCCPWRERRGCISRSTKKVRSRGLCEDSATYGAVDVCEVDAPEVDVWDSTILESQTGMVAGSASNLLRLCTNSSSRRDDAS